MVTRTIKNEQKIYVCKECETKIKELEKTKAIKEKIKAKLYEIMNTYSDEFKKIFGWNEKERLFQPQSPLLLSKVDKNTAQELISLIEILPDHDKKVKWNGFSEHFPFGIYVLSKKVKEEEIKNLTSINSMMNDSYGDKFLSSLALVVKELKEIVEGKEEPKQKCSECGKELFTRKIKGGNSKDTESNEITYQGRKICVDWHHELVKKENQQKSQESPNESSSQEPQLPREQPKSDQAKKYVRKYSAVKVNCCSGKCQRSVDDESVESDTMSCSRCQTKFSQGYAVHAPNVFFCEKCGQENSANGEFKVWIEAVEEKKETRNIPAEPNSPVRQPHPDNLKKWGSDFGQLKPLQREGRLKTQNSWTQKKGINFICIHCQKIFPYDKTIENYLEARQKALNELNIHKKSCSLKNSEEAKNKMQTWWEEKRKSKGRVIKTCEKCWGKVLWDKKIKDFEQARQQALSDLKYHQGKECGMEGKKKIAIYHSPNSGGNEHAR